MALLIYRLAIRLYVFSIRIASLWNEKARLFIAGRKALSQRIQQSLQNEQRPRIWMHCASLGEFEQGRPVLEAIRKQYPHYAIVLTFFSPSGYEVRKNYEGVDYVFYLPIDTTGNARSFLDAVHPQLALFVKYEFWYNYLYQLSQRQIPTLLISAIFRREQPFFRWYGGLYKRMLRSFTHVFVQDASSQLLLSRIPLENATIAGDTRFDRVAAIAAQAPDITAATDFCEGHPVIVAGSTWPTDEHVLQQVFAQLPADWKLIIAPHEVHKAHINHVIQLFTASTVRLSEWENDVAKRILVVDSIGLLSALYRYATIAWIGGGFDTTGVHNVLEAAVYGKPSLYGPVYEKYREAVDLIQAGGAKAVHGAEEALNLIHEWHTDKEQYRTAAKASREYVNSNTGGTERILHYIIEKNFLSIP